MFQHQSSMTKNGLTLSSLTHRHILSDTSHLYSLIQAAETAGFIKVIRNSQCSAFLKVSTGSLGSLGNPKCYAGLRTVSASEKGKSTALEKRWLHFLCDIFCWLYNVASLNVVDFSE